ncbi:MAG: sulfur carrier protein ThiS adenylyltransferase ThiF [Desulfuromonadales bacterium]|nr:sulfur carrier protein ThiS adenylyltransferase ThiF [Desulfuromonadales bacterium]MBN2792236.1 sulfur carrier protein ThiS adenylyltransferase ThiF [Desulfuromonadales bacterium]
MLNIKLNEIPLKIENGLSALQLRQIKMPSADLVILNGFPLQQDCSLQEGDQVVMIQRGKIPDPDELETLLAARHSPGIQQKIKSGRVGIAGIGGLGSSVAVALARIGIGELHIADFDIVEPSNLNRQHYFIDQIGMPKVAALNATIERINPKVNVIGYAEKITQDNLERIFGQVDILVEAFDSASEKTWLTNSFLRRFPDKVLIAASGVAGYEPSNSIRTRKISEHFYLCGDGITAAAPGCGLMAPRVGIAAHHQANAVLRALLDLGVDEQEDLCS